MAKKELYRKIIATVLTVAVLGCALGICVWLLASSSLFSNTLRIIMLVCTLALATAIIGLIVCKVQEIRTLNDIVKLDQNNPPAGHPDDEDDFLSQFVSGEEMNLGGQTPPAAPAVPPVQPMADDPFASAAAPAENMPDFSVFDAVDPFAQEPAGAQTIQPAQQIIPVQGVQPAYPAQPVQYAQAVQPTAQQAPAAPVAQTQPMQPEPVQSVQAAAVQAPVYEAQPTVQTAMPEQAPEPAVQHNWKPINFHSFSEDNTLTQQQQAAQQAAVTAQQQYEQQLREAQALRQAQLAQEQAEAERQQRMEEEARRAALLEEAKRIQAQRRAQQMQMAQAARVGDVTNPVNTDQLDALARAQQAQPAQQQVQQPVQTPQPIAQAVQSNILSQVEQQPQETAPEPVQEEPPVVVQKLNVKPIAWPAPPPPSKIFVTSQIPLITDEMIAAEKARQAAKNAAGQWENSTANLNQAQPANLNQAQAQPQPQAQPLQ